MKIGIVCPVINLWRDFTKPCLDSIKTKYDYRIVLVDNASTDETCEEAGRMVSENFMHKRNEEKWPLAKSWNYGIKDSFEKGADYVFVINNDILLHPDAIDNLVDYFKIKSYSSSHRLGIVTCMNVKGECDEKGNPSKIFELKSEDKKGVPISEHPDFAAFMLSKNCWNSVGEFDEGFRPAYFEDNDYHRRLCLSGYYAVTLPTAMFYHVGSKTQNMAEDKPQVPGLLFERNRDYFREKWGGGPNNDEPGTHNLWLYPFNDEKKSAQWTLQDAHRGGCDCNVSCGILLKRFDRS